MQPDHQGQARDDTAMRARATLVGAFRLYYPDGREILISSRRARALLAILCLSDGEPIERDMLRKLLWPGRYLAQGKASLRQCLLNLGRLLVPLGPDVLVITRNSVALQTDAITIDLLEVIAPDRPILAELDLGEPFFQWVAARRLELARGSLPGEASPIAPLEVKSLEKLERKRLQVLKAPTKTAEAKPIKIADKIANLRDLKTSPPSNWNEARVGAYIQFAEMVAGGCAETNPSLDEMFDDARAAFV